MDIGDVLSRAWQIVWKHKVMWIFGILASCSGAGGNSGTGYRFSSLEIGGQPPFYTQLNISTEQWALIAILLVVVTLVLVLLAILLSTVGQIGLIRGTLNGGGWRRKNSLWRAVLGRDRVFLANLRPWPFGRTCWRAAAGAW